MLNDTISRIKPLDETAAAAARTRQDTLTKPPGSLGRLEALSIQIAGITGQPIPSIKDKVIITMAGDHGVVKDGVSAFPQEVTPQMVMNFLHGGAAINSLARHVGARIVVVDMGVAVDMPAHPQLLVRKVAQRMGGRVGVESEEGRGSLFWLELRRAISGVEFGK